jgi:hypothetical protein
MDDVFAAAFRDVRPRRRDLRHRRSSHDAATPVSEPLARRLTATVLHTNLEPTQVRSAATSCDVARVITEAEAS